ncbi:MAG: hypothetical protein R6V50_08055 [Thermoplasmatota archaeon]
MTNIESSEVVKQVLAELFTIAKRKTNEGYAISIMNSLLHQLQDQYSFLEHIQIKDTRYLEGEESVSVLSIIDATPAPLLGKALRSILLSMNETLGVNAGFFMIKELKNRIDDSYHYTLIDEMRLDLGLLQLECEVSKMQKELQEK